MSYSYSTRENAPPSPASLEKKYKGIRRRKWGKWVSEIRVPGRSERLWLGSYSFPEAAAMAHDVALFALRRPYTLEKLNFPVEMLPPSCFGEEMSPLCVQKLASDAGMAVDAQLTSQGFPEMDPMETIRSGAMIEGAAEIELMDSLLYSNIDDDDDGGQFCYEGRVLCYTSCAWDRSQELKTNSSGISVEDYINY